MSDERVQLMKCDECDTVSVARPWRDECTVARFSGDSLRKCGGMLVELDIASLFAGLTLAAVSRQENR